MASSWVHGSWESYLKAADQQPIGSDVSTATGSSTPSSNAVRRLGSDPVLSDRHRSSSNRTPLSASAKPFITSLSASAKPFVASWESRPYAASSSSVRQGLQRPLPPGPLAALEEDYDVSYPYSEMLQEQVYLSEVEQELCEQYADQLPFRTESPPDTVLQVALTEAASTAASWFSRAAETIADTLSQRREVPVKRTFIHYDYDTYDEFENDTSSEQMLPRLTKSSSAPSILLSTTFQIIKDMVALHERGVCRPCAYFYNKEDGCRLDDKCQFCHLCPPNEIKKRKKKRRQTYKDFKAQTKLGRVESNLSLESGNIADEPAEGVLDTDSE